MGIASISMALLVAFALPAGLQAQAVMPLMSSVEPASGKPGDVLVVTGSNLGRDQVSAVYLTDGAADWKLPIVEQTETSIRFRIPPDAKPGRYALMVLTRENTPKLIEQPVKMTVEPETAGLRPSWSGGRRLQEG